MAALLCHGDSTDRPMTCPTPTCGLGSARYMALDRYWGLALSCWRGPAFAGRRFMASGRVWIASGAAAALLGCAAPSSDWRDYASGWRKGYISQVGPSAALNPRVDSDCRRSRSIAEKYEFFAAVTYFTRRGAIERRVVPLMPGSEFKKGDWVVLNVNQCERMERQ